MEDYAKEIENYIKLEINEFTPTHVVTFEPGGVYGHPDHIITSTIVTDIVARNKYIQLIYATVPLNTQFSASSKAMARNPQKIKPLQPGVIVKLTINEFITKIRALRAYKTQMRGKKRSLRRKIEKILLARNEFFTQRLDY